MITVSDVEVSSDILKVHVSILVFELSLVLFGLFVLLVAGYVIFVVHPHFHPHVHCITAIFFISYLVISLPRAIIILLYFSNEADRFEISTSSSLSIQLDGLRTAGASAALLSAPLLVLERVVATVRIRTYEKERFYFILCIVISIQWALCFSCIYAILEYNLELFYFLLAGFFCIMIASAVFYYLFNWSENEYNRNSSKYPLTVKFQLSENVRFGRVLKATLQVFGVGGMICLIIVLLVKKLSFVQQSPIWTLMLYHVFELLVASFSTYVALVTINSNAVWRRSFVRTIKAIPPWNRSRIDQQPLPGNRILSLSGETLVFDPTSNANHHFLALQQVW